MPRPETPPPGWLIGGVRLLVSFRLSTSVATAFMTCDALRRFSLGPSSWPRAFAPSSSVILDIVMHACWFAAGSIYELISMHFAPASPDSSAESLSGSERT